MIVSLIVYLCTAADRADCQVYAHSQYQGANASMQCETVREILLQGRGDTRNMTLTCETDSVVAAQ